MLPVLQTIATNPMYLDNPIIKKYPEEVELMSSAAAAAASTSASSRRAHKPNVKARRDRGLATCIAELVQRVVLNGEDAEDRRSARPPAAIEAIMKA